MSDDFQAPPTSRSALRKQYRAALRAAVLSAPGVAGFDAPLLKRLRGDSGLWFRDARGGGVRVRLRLKLKAGHSAAAVAQHLRERLMPPPLEVVQLDVYFGRIVKARGRGVAASSAGIQEYRAMKTLLMKLCSLLVLALGALLLAWALRLTPVTEPLWKYYTEFMSGEAVSPMVVQVIAAAVLLVLGLLAFLPSGNPRSLRRAVLVPSEHGQVAVQLDALRPVLLKVLRKMPEVRKVKLAIKPPRGKKKAIVTAFVSLRQQANLDLRQHVDIITQHIAETAVKLLGIANLVDIEVFVDGLKVDAKAAAQAVLASKETFETRLLAQAAPVAAGALAYEAAAVAEPAAAEAPIELAAAVHDEEPEEDEVTEEEEAEHDDNEAYVEDETITEALAEEEEELLASGEELIPAFVESENAPPLPPIDPEALVTPSDATHNAFDSDAGYVLPPMSEQEEALNPKPGDESDPDALEEAAIAEHVSDAHEAGLELNDPLAEALREDDEATAIPDGDFGGAEEAEAKTLGLEPMDGADAASTSDEPGASNPGDEPPLPPEAPRKRWSFF